MKITNVSLIEIVITTFVSLALSIVIETVLTVVPSNIKEKLLERFHGIYFKLLSLTKMIAVTVVVFLNNVGYAN